MKRETNGVRDRRRRAMLEGAQVSLLRAARLARLELDEGGAQLCEAAAKYLLELMPGARIGRTEPKNSLSEEQKREALQVHR